MKFSLVTTQGKDAGRAIVIPMPEFLIGRDPDCQLRPASPLVSKRHCLLVQRGGKVFVRDFGSTNGTQVNNVPVKGEMELHDNDRLKIGPLMMIVRLEADPPPAPVGVPKAKPPQQAATAPARPKLAAAPAPAAKPKPRPQAAPVDEDMAAAMLLNLQDDSPAETVAAEPGQLSEDSIPLDSTVMEMPAFNPDAVEAGAEEPPGGKKPEPAKKEEKKPQGDTSAAAAALLQKYARRHRPGS